MANLVTEKLSVSFGGLQALRQVDLQLEEHHLGVLLGPRGSGKSTLLRSINRLLEDRDEARLRGRILLGGQDVYHDMDAAEAKARIGMLFPQPAIFGGDIMSNVAYPLRLRGIKDKSLLFERGEETLRQVDLWDEVKSHLSRDPHLLTPEQQQRLCLARILTLEPELLLLDNPWQSIDIGSRTHLEEVVRSLRESITILASLYMIDLVGRISDDTFFILDGELIEAGPTEELFYRPVDNRTCDFINGRLRREVDV